MNMPLPSHDPAYPSRPTASMECLHDELAHKSNLDGHIPPNGSSARTFVASRILEYASKGENTYDSRLAAGRRAVLDQFTNGLGIYQAARSDDVKVFGLITVPHLS
jgi:hypothetical protein